MLALCTALVMTQIPAQPPDAPMAPNLTPSPDTTTPAPVPTQPPADPNQGSRIWLTGGAGIVGAGAAFGLVMLFADVRSRVTTSGTAFDTVFATAALGSLLVAGFSVAAHQLLGGRGEVALAALASVACMAVVGLAVNVAQFDPTTGSALVAAIGAVPAAVSVTAVLEATGALARGRVRAW
jgi:hypothetical protein